MMTDPISDMLTRIRNAATAHLDRTDMPLSKLKKNVAEILKAEGYVADVRVSEENHGTLTVVLKYGRDRKSAIVGLRRTSRPGRRVYIGHEEISPVHNGLGIAILSTSHGVMTDRDARKNKVGGELLCEVW